MYQPDVLRSKHMWTPGVAFNTITGTAAGQVVGRFCANTLYRPANGGTPNVNVNSLFYTQRYGEYLESHVSGCKVIGRVTEFATGPPVILSIIPYTEGNPPTSLTMASLNKYGKTYTIQPGGPPVIIESFMTTKKIFGVSKEVSMDAGYGAAVGNQPQAGYKWYWDCWAGSADYVSGGGTQFTLNVEWYMEQYVNWQAVKRVDITTALEEFKDLSPEAKIAVGRCYLGTTTISSQLKNGTPPSTRNGSVEGKARRSKYGPTHTQGLGPELDQGPCADGIAVDDEKKDYEVLTPPQTPSKSQETKTSALVPPTQQRPRLLCTCAKQPCLHRIAVLEKSSR